MPFDTCNYSIHGFINHLKKEGPHIVDIMANLGYLVIKCIIYIYIYIWLVVVYCNSHILQNSSTKLSLLGFLSKIMVYVLIVTSRDCLYQLPNALIDAWCAHVFIHLYCVQVRIYIPCMDSTFMKRQAPI